MPSQKTKSLLTVDIVCLFPNSLEKFFCFGLLARAQKNNLLEVNLYDLRDFAQDKRRNVDDRPFGGGAGMVLKVEPLSAAVEKIRLSSLKRPYVLLTSPSGQQFNQKLAEKLIGKKHLVIVCGRYEGVDERFIENYVDEEVSIGDYVLTGGEAAALVMVETFCRLIPGVLGNKMSLTEESFNQGLLEYPQYTRPEIFKGRKVPSVLISGDHKKIHLWRLKKSLEKTKKNRPDLLE